MVSTGKLVMLALLGAVAIILGSTALTLSLILNQRKDHLTQNPTLAVKSHERHSNSTTATRRDFLPSRDLNAHREYAPDPTSPSASADGHFFRALKLFGSDGYPLGKGMLNSYYSKYGLEPPKSRKRSRKKLIFATSAGGGEMKSWTVPSIADMSLPFLEARLFVSSLVNKMNPLSRKRAVGSSHRKSSESKERRLEEAYIHLEMAADMGHPEAQFAMGHILSVPPSSPANLTRGLTYLHMASLSGHVEALTTLAYRIYQSYAPEAKSLFASENQGVVGGCDDALKYYLEASNGLMDELENGIFRGKVVPKADGHRLAEIHLGGGTGSVMASYNKPDEHSETLEYLKIKATSSLTSPTEIHAALTLANLHHHGYRGAPQDLNLALKYYEIAAEGGSVEGAGMAGHFHLYGIGYNNVMENTTSVTMHGNIDKAYKYLEMGMPGGFQSCWGYHHKRERNDMEECDGDALNGIGVLYLLGEPKEHVRVSRDTAQAYFVLAKNMGCVDALYNLAMMRLGWLSEWEHPDEKETEEPDLNKLGEQEVEIGTEMSEAGGDDENADDEDYYDDDGDYEKSKIYTIDFSKLKNELNTDDMEILEKEIGKIFAKPEDIGQDGENGPLSIYDALEKNDQEDIATNIYDALQKSLSSLKAPSGIDDIAKQALISLTVTEQKSGYGGMKRTKAQRFLPPTRMEWEKSITELSRAHNKNHVQASHRLGLMYAHGVSYSGRNIINPNCPAGVKVLQTLVMRNSHYLARRTKKAYKSYIKGDSVNALRHYLVAAEQGSETAMVNAAWLMEKGVCLDRFSKKQCAEWSLRYWKIAAKGDNAEATLRAGDFYYYGKLDAEEITTVPKFWEQLWQYILYPEVMLSDGKVELVRLVRKHIFNKEKISTAPDCTEGSDEQTCPNTTDPESTPSEKSQKLRHQNFATAAEYYHHAATTHADPRANFNLGFMHEWGLGLKQDFPLAKRHYDRAASSEPSVKLAVKLALWSMNTHERIVKMRLKWSEFSGKIPDKETSAEDEQEKVIKEGMIQKNTLQMFLDGSYGGSNPVIRIILSHVWSWEIFVVVNLIVILVRILRHRRVRNT